MVSSLLPGDSTALRKQRGAFFTPPEIADFLVDWALRGRKNASVLDPTCGEGIFLLAAARQLGGTGASAAEIKRRLYGVDLHGASLKETRALLRGDGFDAKLAKGDFFEQASPSQLGATLPWMDAVVGNPPFVRYHEHRGDARKRSVAAALAQGVRLSGLASSWAALLVHACSFLKADGRVAMVLPAELLTVGYAEPIRRWLQRRFEKVHLVLFDQLQFSDAEEHVVLLVAQGSGGCDSFVLHQVHDAEDLKNLHIFDAASASPDPEGKWTDLLLPVAQRNLFKRLNEGSFTPLASYGAPELGTVTGANSFFALPESTRSSFGIDVKHLTRIVPPGTRHLSGSTFTRGRWEQLRLKGSRVWLLDPVTLRPSGGLARYIEHGKRESVHEAYKCTVRNPWWRPPTVRPPDLFFTYMSHRFPRLVTNLAGTSFLNSMHGLRLKTDAPGETKEALPLLALNSVTALGAEVRGRSYGGGILKMEPSEAAELPMPEPDLLVAAWAKLSPRRAQLDELLCAGEWDTVIHEVDSVLLRDCAGIPADELDVIRGSTSILRRRRMGKGDVNGS